MLQEGLRRGHDITIVTPEIKDKFAMTPSDFLILSNVTDFNPTKIAALPNRFAVFHHDFAFQCRWRCYYPVTEKCKTDCPQSPLWKPVMEKAVLHVFLSPLHHRMVSEVYGQAVEPHVLVPSAINPDEFFDHSKPDRKGYASLNGLIPFKGRKNVLEFAGQHPESEFTFAGASEGTGELPPNAKFVGPIPESHLRQWYNDYEWYVHLPSSPQAFERVVCEAYLCGCKIRANENVGAMSWPWMRDGREAVAEKLRQAPKDFWSAVEAVL